VTVTDPGHFDLGAACRILADGLPAFALLLVAAGIGRIGSACARPALLLAATAAASLLLQLAPCRWDAARLAPWQAVAALIAAAAAAWVVMALLSWRACLLRMHRRLAVLEQETATLTRAEAIAPPARRIEAIGEIAGGIAHDFNNLLTVVMASLESLEARLEPQSPLRRYVGRAMSGAERGAGLTRQLLAIARHPPPRPIPFDAAAHVRDTIDRLRSLLEPGVALELDADPAGAWIESDPSQFDAALVNLLLNAGEAMPQGGRVTISVRNAMWQADGQAADGAVPPPGACVAITVADDGRGMTEQVRRAAFAPFFTTKPAGHGLGLAQVDGFVRQSHGHVVLHSAPGGGTSITLWLRRIPRD
jgi:signal transduction histidine kinase